MATAAPITGDRTFATPHVTLVTITRFCRAKGIAESRFGRDALGDPALIGQMRHGRSLRPETRARVAAYMASKGRA
jgi:hypothetical protein